MIATLSKIEKVPFVFRMPDTMEYPPNNTGFEHWFYENYKSEENNSDRVYLPIMFTSYYRHCNYGEDKGMVAILQDYLNRLDTSKKYFVCIQWDDGVLNDLSHLDVKVFSMAGGRKDYGLPLLCAPHKYKFDVNRDIFASFAGRLTHPIRNKMIGILQGEQGYYMSTIGTDIASYCGLLARSVFSLSPRGYSPTSFRISESIEFGSIPVYISDIFYEPHGIDFNTYGVKIEERDISRIDEILKSISQEEIKEKQNKLKEVYDTLFSFEANKKIILENLYDCKRH